MHIITQLLMAVGGGLFGLAELYAIWYITEKQRDKVDRLHRRLMGKF